MTLPPLSIFAARSFWLMAASLICMVAEYLGYDFGAPDVLADHLLTAASAIMAILAYRERLNPNRRLTASGPVK